MNHNSEAEAEDTENLMLCHVNGTCNDINIKNALSLMPSQGRCHVPWPAACTYSQSTCQVEGNLLIVVVTGNGFIVFPFHVWWRLKTIEIKETTEIECHFIIGSQNSYICLSGEDVLVFSFNFVLYTKNITSLKWNSISFVFCWI